MRLPSRFAAPSTATKIIPHQREARLYASPWQSVYLQRHSLLLKENKSPTNKHPRIFLSFPQLTKRQLTIFFPHLYSSTPTSGAHPRAQPFFTLTNVSRIGNTFHPPEKSASLGSHLNTVTVSFQMHLHHLLKAIPVERSPSSIPFNYLCSKASCHACPASGLLCPTFPASPILCR